MENSASNHPKETPENFAFFHISDASYNPDYGIYNSTGQLLNGSKFFERYTELAMQLDTKRSAFYLELKEKEILFGCSLSVKADNGREERVVFIQIYKNLQLQDKISSNIELLKQFYRRVKYEVENLDLEKYRLVGFWDEEDFRNIREISIEKDVLEYTAGKIYTGKKVSVKILELSSGLSLILKLIDKLRYSSPFICDVSQYPSESNVSVSRIKPDPDFEIEADGTCRKLTKPELWKFYTEIGEEFFKDENNYSKRSQAQQDSVGFIVKKILHEPTHYCSYSNPIFDDSDDRDKVEIFQGLIQKATDTNDTNVRRILTNIYHKTETSECRKDLHKALISKNIYIEELIKDLVITIGKEHNKELFSLLFYNSSGSFSVNCSEDEWAQKKFRRDSKYDSFEKGVKNALKELEYSYEVNFVKFIVNEAPSKSKVEGKILLENLVEDLVKLKGNNNFILKLSEEEVENLDEILGTNLLSTKRKLEKRKRNRSIKTVFYAGSLVMIILIFCYFIPHTCTTGIGGENNSSDNSTESFILYKLKGFKSWCENRSHDALDGVITSEENQETMQNDTKNETYEKCIEKIENNESAKPG